MNIFVKQAIEDWRRRSEAPAADVKETLMMDATNWPELTKGLSAELKNLRGGAPELTHGALDVKTKELIAIGISVAVRCDDCIAFHVKAAVERGATREEILETLGMAIYMGAGPSAMYASHALGAYTQFAAAKSAEAA
jgi:AhpD family alkylhydroperoxidase